MTVPLILLCAVCLGVLASGFVRVNEADPPAAQPTCSGECVPKAWLVRSEARSRKRLKRLQGMERARNRLRYVIRQLRSSYHPTVDACLDQLIERESHWNVHATNPTTGAYGLPQALPGSKMKSAGPDWRDNAATQIRWMVGYVNARYGGSCAALSFQVANGWY